MRGRTFDFDQAVMFSSVPVVAVLSWQLVPVAPCAAVHGCRSSQQLGHRSAAPPLTFKPFKMTGAMYNLETGAVEFFH
jgi:hypothetical protein